MHIERQNTYNNFAESLNEWSWLLLKTIRRFWYDQRLALLLLAVALPIAVIVGYGFSRFGLITVVLGLAVIGLMLILKVQNEIYLYYVAGLLGGYLFLSKGFAYIGFFPLYVSEGGLAAGIGTVLILFFINRRNLRVKALMKIEVLFMLIFVASQIPATIPYFGEHGINVIRDALQWGYVIYTLSIGLLLTKSDINRMLRWYHIIFPLLVLWLPIFFLVARALYVPIHWPGSPYSLFTTKGSDLAVHFGAAGAYLLLRMDRFHSKRWSPSLIWLMWIMMSVGLLVIAIFGRAAFIASVSAMFIAVVIRPTTSWIRPVAIGCIGISILLITGWYSTIEIDLGIGRKISAEQLMLNLSSIVGEGVNSDEHGHLEGTKEWRINWWTDIVNYTFFGEYFWTGKGYGISLADSDGYQVGAVGELRAPHNGHLTFLARGGVPGFFLWLIYVALSLAFLIRKIVSPYVSPRAKQYAIWFLSYNLAFHVAISFDVLMEGPMGGIWYWALQGIMYVYLSVDTEGQNSKLKTGYIE